MADTVTTSEGHDRPCERGELGGSPGPHEITWGELHVGSRSIFAAAGFAEVSRPTLRRVAANASVLLIRPVAVVEEDGVARGVAQPGPVADA
jgi:hypothetical protein